MNLIKLSPPSKHPLPLPPTTNCSTASYGGVHVGWSVVCSLKTITETYTITDTASLTLSAALPAESCPGHSFFPDRAPFGVNFTLTVHCRQGLVGERLFLTRTPGECRVEDSVLLGDDGATSFAEYTSSDALSHPRYSIPPIFETGWYQVCLYTLQDHTHPLPYPLLEVKEIDIKSYVSINGGNAVSGVAGVAFNLTVFGYNLNGGRVGLSKSKYCDSSHMVWEGDVVRDAYHDEYEFFKAGISHSFFAAADYSSATAVPTLDAVGRYYSCFKVYSDEVYTAHASFEITEQTLQRVSITPTTLYPHTQFLLTLFGSSLQNYSDYSEANSTLESQCKFIAIDAPWDDAHQSEQFFHESRCVEEGSPAFHASVINDQLTCLFPDGAPKGGWYYACILKMNSTVDISDTSYHPVQGGATFFVKNLEKMAAYVTPSHPETKAFFSVVVQDYHYEASKEATSGYMNDAFIKITNTIDCGAASDDNSSMLTPNDEVRVHRWGGPTILSLPRDSSSCATTWSGDMNFPPANNAIGAPYILHSCRPADVAADDINLVSICSNNATRLFTGAVYTLSKEECLELGTHSGDGTPGPTPVYHPSSHKCDVGFCRASFDTKCHHKRTIHCNLSGGFAIMGIGHCIKDAIFVTRIGLEMTAFVCGGLHGRFDRGRCWLDVCKAADLPNNWYPEERTDFKPLFVSEPLVVNKVAYPVSLCLKQKYSDLWRWIGGFGVDDSCTLKKAKYCRYSTCGGHLSPGPCRLNGVESNAIERTYHADYQSYLIDGERSAQTGVHWGDSGVFQGPSNFLQKICSQLACHPKRPYVEPGWVPSDHIPVRFEKNSPHQHHPSWVLSPDGLEARLLHSETAYRIEEGEEVHVMTSILPLEEGAELSFAFVVYDIEPAVLTMGFVGNTTVADEAVAGAFYNSSQTPLQYSSSLNATGSKCLLATARWYRVIIQLHPAEIAVWPDSAEEEITGAPLCYLHRQTSFQQFYDIGWRFGFVVKSNVHSFIPETDRARIRLRP